MINLQGLLHPFARFGAAIGATFFAHSIFFKRETLSSKA
jgi:hypothetical protein